MSDTEPGTTFPLFEHDFAFALGRLRETGECKPIFIVESDGDIILMPVAWGDEAEKERAIKVLRLVCVAADATLVSLISECWMRVIKRAAGETDAEIRRRGRAVPVREAEDRSEGIVVARARRSADGLQVMTREIERDDTGAVIGLKADRYEIGDGAGIGHGWMNTVIPPAPVPPTLRAHARNVLESMQVHIEALDKAALNE